MAKIQVSRSWSLKEKILTLFYAFKDDRTPLYAKITSFSSLIYLLSPADFVPDIIPLAGYIDDLFIVPFLINISTRLLPADVKRVAEQKARSRGRKLTWILVLCVVIILAILAGLFFLIRPLFD